MFRKFFVLLIYDLIFFPLQYAINFFYQNNNEDSKYIINGSGTHVNPEEVCIIIHHYALRGLRSRKIIGNKKYLLGLENILTQAELLKIKCHIYVADSEDNYFFHLESRFPSLKFLRTNSSCYDFGSYVQAAKKEMKSKESKIKYYCMMNDNIDLNSDLKKFLSYSVCSFSNIPDLSLVGVGTNTEVRQSLFQAAFHPHIQTYCFIVRKNIFDNFCKENDINEIKKIKILRKQIICRFLEQGLSSFILRKGNSFGIFKDKEIILYNRTMKFIDLKKDWLMERGDSRIKADNPFRIDRGINE